MLNYPASSTAPFFDSHFAGDAQERDLDSLHMAMRQQAAGLIELLKNGAPARVVAYGAEAVSAYDTLVATLQTDLAAINTTLNSIHTLCETGE